MTSLPRIPTTSDFRRIRRENRLYIDKTAHIAAFLNEGGDALLFTRPRRFGKSLMLSTMAAMYSGKRELFGDDADRPELAAYQEGVWHWDTRPVLRLDMSGLQDTGSGIGPALADLVYVAARLMNIQEQFYFQRDNPVISLVDLIRTVTARWIPGSYPGG